MVYLAPEVRSGLGEDTFWTWFNREFESSFKVPAALRDEDWLLQYGTLGEPRVKGGRTLGLLWELYPEMQAFGCGGSDKILQMKACEKSCDASTVSTRFMLDYFKAVVLPIGVDTDLFCEKDREEMRKKHKLSGRVGFWSGTNHPMKGRDRLEAYKKDNPDVKWIEVEKKSKTPQKVLSELMSCADFALFTGRLRPYYMVEWEVMACNVPIIDISGVEREFTPSSYPRNDVMDQGWSRHQTKESWAKFLAS